MAYDAQFFDTFPCRMGTDCDKWDALRRKEGADLLPMWVADMDFRSPPEVTQALVRRATHGIYGYTEQSTSAQEALLGFVKRRHGLNLTSDQQCMLPCVVTGLKAAVRTLTQPGDAVIIQPPVYGPFFSSIRDNDRVVAESPLLADAQGRYRMDFESIRHLCETGAKLMLLCSPHNPVGRCWTRDELEQLWDILSHYGVPLVSDEIHWDFIFDKDAFTSFLALPQVQNHSAPIAVLTSASKTFNLAGLQQACLLTRNTTLLKSIQSDMQKAGVVQGNVFGMLAAQVAYEQGDAWLDGLLAYLRQSRDILHTELSRLLPQAILSPLEATYLAWVDLRAYGFSNQELLMRTHRAGVAFTMGTFFGTQGDGFLRINLACPHSQLRHALALLHKAVTQPLVP
ncbi:MAG: pyridoxal phosphate-dependent aminotransferase [Clostridiales bacterium]|nr:pyridoxal phosphate-dependent aminotransferase [Clostridiales bacterium]